MLREGVRVQRVGSGVKDGGGSAETGEDDDAFADDPSSAQDAENASQDVDFDARETLPRTARFAHLLTLLPILLTLRFATLGFWRRIAARASPRADASPQTPAADRWAEPAASAEGQPAGTQAEHFPDTPQTDSNAVMLAGKMALFVAVFVAILSLLPQDQPLREASPAEWDRAMKREITAHRLRFMRPQQDALEIARGPGWIEDGPPTSDALAPPQEPPSVSASPPAFCAALASAGFANSGWAQSALFSGEWECLTDTAVAVVGAADGDLERIFLSVKGRDERAINIIRLKLNFTRDIDAAAMMAAVKPLLDVLAANGDLDMSEVADGIAQMKPFRLKLGRGRVQFFREHGEAVRYNLIFDFPR